MSDQAGQLASTADSSQLQPDFAHGVRLQLRGKRSKYESLNYESRSQTERPSNQKPTGALSDVAECDSSEQDAF